MLKLVLGLFFITFFTSTAVQFLQPNAFKDAPQGAGYFIGIASSITLVLGVLLLTSARKDYRVYKSGKAPINTINGSSFFQRFPSFCSFIDNFSFNGFGTKLMTLHDQKQDGSFAAVQWFIVGHFPILPLYQVRLKKLIDRERGIPLVYSISKSEYEKYERLPINNRLVRWTYVVFYFLFIPLIALPILLFLVDPHPLIKVFSGPSFWWLILIYFAWGIYIYGLWQYWNNHFFLRKEFKIKG